MAERWRYRAKSHHDENGLHGSPSVRPSPKAIDWARGRKPWTVRGRQGLAESQQDVRDVSIRFAARRSGVQKGQTLPLRVWVSRPHVDGG